MKILNIEFKRKIQVSEELHEKKRLPMLTRRQIASIIYALFKTNDVQMRAVGSDDLPIIEVRNDNLKMFHQAGVQTLMAMEKITGKTPLGQPLPTSPGIVYPHDECLVAS